MTEPLRGTSWKRLLPSGGFLSPVITLLSGTIAAQAVIYLSRPLLTRIYTQDEFGILAFLVSVAAILAAAASVRYEDAVMLPEREEAALNLVVLSTLLIGTTTALSFLILFWRSELASLFRTPALEFWLVAVPFLLVFLALMRLCEVWHTRVKRYKAVSAGRLLHGTVMTAGQVVAGILGAGALGLIVGYIAGIAAAVVFLFGWLLASHTPTFAHVSVTDMRRLAHRYRDFARYSTPASFLNTLSSHLPKLLLLYFFSAEVVGLFWLAHSMLAVPASLIGGSISQVFFVKAAEARRTGNLTALTAMVHRRLLLFGIFPALALMVAGPEVFSVVFGEGWRISGVYAQFLAPWILFSSVAAPLTRIFDVLEEQRADFVFSTFIFVVQLGALLIGGLSGDALTTMLLFGVSGAAVRFLHVMWMLRLAKVPLREAALRPAVLVLSCLPFLIVIGAVRLLGQDFITVAVTVLAGTIFLAFVAWRERIGSHKN